MTGVQTCALPISCCCGRLHICYGTFAGLSIDAIGIGLCGGHSVLFYCGKRNEVSAGNGWREDVTKKGSSKKSELPLCIIISDLFLHP